jgi:hypothetical protein
MKKVIIILCTIFAAICVLLAVISPDYLSMIIVAVMTLVITAGFVFGIIPNMLFCAGLTRFSGALTSGVLLTCGMADGAALALLWYAATQGLAPVALPVACLLRVATELALRVCMATAACRLARRMDDRDCEGAGDYPSFRLLARYIAAFVLVIGAVAVVCLGYVVLIF